LLWVLPVSFIFALSFDLPLKGDTSMLDVVGSVFSAYPATGSFSRTAVKSKSGVRTPAAGIITGATVVVALYALTDAFFCECICESSRLMSLIVFFRDSKCGTVSCYYPCSH